MERLRRYYGRVVFLTKDKRFIQLGDTHIKDTLTGEEWYAPCEDSLLSLLNEFDERLFERNSEIKVLKCKLNDNQEKINELEYSVELLSKHKDILVDIVSRDPIAKEYLRQLGVITN